MEFFVVNGGDVDAPAVPGTEIVAQRWYLVEEDEREGARENIGRREERSTLCYCCIV